MYNNDEQALSKEQKEELLREYNLKAEKRYKLGKIIVAAIAITNVVITLLSNIIGSFNVINVIIQVAFSVALFMGVRWVKWLFIVGSVLSVLLAFYIFFTSMDILNNTALIWNVTVLIATLIEAVVAGIMLIFSKSVAEFLYDQRTKK